MGARAVHKVLLEGYPDANVNIIIVWINMVAVDSMDKAQEAAHLFSSDSRVSQFYDPGKVSGLEVAAALGAKAGEVAWDIYLFYNQRDQWREQLPPPRDWVHQLKASNWADPERLFRGEALTHKLRAIMSSIYKNVLDGEL